MIHIDTHIFEALYKGWPRRIANRSRALIGDQAVQVSPAVVFELFFVRRTTGIDDPYAAIAELGAYFDVSVAKTRFSDVVQDARHLAWTRDPFDRLIVANAAAEGARLVTKDELIRANFEGALW